jgi:PKD repeat protein
MPPPATGSNRPPDVTFRANPSEGRSPLVVGLNACQTTDADDGFDKLTFRFQFGDGQSDSGRCQVDHTYTSQGIDEYTAQVCVSDGKTEVCKSQVVSVGLGLKVTASAMNGCMVDAEAEAMAGFTSLARIDRVEFVAKDANGKTSPARSVSSGPPWRFTFSGSDLAGFKTGAKVSVTATPYASSKRGSSGSGESKQNYGC